MDPNSILAKTAKGTREIETRENKLDHRLRALLIMVNGKASAADLAGKFEQIGDVTPMLEQLLAQGFVEAAAAAPTNLKAVQAALCSHLSGALGPNADMVTGKIEDCKSVAEVRAYLTGRRDMLDEWLGKAKAPAFWAKVDSLLR